MNAATYESQGKTNLIKTTKTHNDFNYVKVKKVFTFTMTGYKKTVSTHFECNCSVFKEKQDVINFIDSIAG